MSERLTVIDEPARERLVLIARGAWTNVFYLLLWGGLGALMAIPACRLLLRGDRAGWLILGLALVFSGGLMLLPAWELLSPARVITLTRGRVEVARGRELRVFRGRDLRFAELRYSVSRTRSATFHAVSLWLAVELPDDPGTGVQGGWVPALGMTLSDWGATESRQFEQINAALARLGLRERLAPPPEAVERGDPAPRLDVPEAELEPHLRAVLAGPRDLPEGARFLVDASQGEPGFYVFLLIVSLFFAVPADGALVASLLSHPGTWAVKSTADGVGTFVLGSVGLGLAAVPLYLGRQIVLRRAVEARIRAGRWRWGLYLLPDVLLVAREGRVLVMPRGRILGFSWPAQNAPHVQYRSAQGVSELQHLAWKPQSTLMKRPLLADLEAWRTGTATPRS